MTICNNFFNLNTCCLVSVFKIFHYEWFWIFGTKRFYLNGLVFVSTPTLVWDMSAEFQWSCTVPGEILFFKLCISEPFLHKRRSNVYRYIYDYVQMYITRVPVLTLKI